MEIKGALFCSFAGRNQERWDLLVGRAVQHATFGRGLVDRVELDGRLNELTLYISFPERQDGAKSGKFSPLILNQVGIDFPAQIALRIHQAVDNRPGGQGCAPVSPLQPRREGSHATPPQLFQPGQEVCVINAPAQRGKIHRASGYVNGNWNYEVYFSSENIRTYKERDLKLYSPGIVCGGVLDYLRELAYLKLSKPQGDALYALYGSRTKFEVYQFKPAVKFLANPDQRLLIADEVGLGKTIEAGIIFLELQARLGLDRVLIVCPSSLRYKWQAEMKSRFDEDFTILDTQGLLRFLENYKLQGAQTHLRGIVSLEAIRRREIAEKFINVKFDLLVIDEAHHCRNTATLANAIASTLTENSDAALLLTATPLQMGREDLFNLLNILSPGEFDNFQIFSERLAPNQYINRAAQLLAAGKNGAALRELRQVETTTERQRFQKSPYYQTVVRILSKPLPNHEELITAQRRLLELNTLSSVFTRTRKRDILTNVPKRTAYTLTVNFSEEEKEFYEQVVEDVRFEFMREHWNGMGSGWVTIMKERQAASCISALMKKQAAAGEVSPEEEAFEGDFASSELEDEEPESRPYQLIFENPFVDPNEHLKVLRRRKRITHLNKDSKFEVFWGALKKILEDNPTSKVLVFSFFVGTIEHVTRELTKLGVNVRMIHGKINVSDRQKIIEEFQDNPAIRVLISSDVGSEGLDFQFCDTLFNYDLPWNPMKVEQRIGRIDRFGQTANRIRIYNLVIEDSVESRILMRLYERIEIFKQSVGDIEVILGDQIRELTQAVFSSRLSPREEIEQAEKAAENILRQKQEMEDFEQNKLQFLGQEAILSSAVTDTVDSGRFISEVEIRALVQGYIEDRFPLSRLERNLANEETFSLIVNTDFSESIRSFIERNKKFDRSSQQFLTKAFAGKTVPLTFSHDLAYQRKLLEFVTPRHPLTQAAKDHWAQKREGVKLLARIQIATRVAPPGSYYFFIYSMDSAGISRNTRIVPIVITAQTGEMHKDLSEQFIRLSQLGAQDDKGGSAKLENSLVEDAESRAVSYMAQIRDQLYHELETSNDALVNARVSAVEQSYFAKRTRIEGILRKVSNPSIQRLYKGQLNNLETRKDIKIHEIQEGRKFDVSFSLQIRGVVEVVQNA